MRDHQALTASSELCTCNHSSATPLTQTRAFLFFSPPSQFQNHPPLLLPSPPADERRAAHSLRGIRVNAPMCSSDAALGRF